MQTSPKPAIPEQIDIMVNNACNARCAMCIQEVTHKAKVVADGEFLTGVQKHIGDYHSLGGRKVIITGGEPTLQVWRVTGVLDELRRHSDLDLIAFYTNGSRLQERDDDDPPIRMFGPFRPIEHRLGHDQGRANRLFNEMQKTVAERLLDRGLRTCNLSVHHYARQKNSRIFGIETDPAAVSAHLRDIGLPFRYCATLQPGGLETVADVIRYIRFACKQGATDVYLRELFDVSAVRQRSGKRAYPASIPLEPIIEALLTRGFSLEGERTDFQGRNKREYLLTSQTGYRVFCSTLDIGTEQREKLPYLIIMPNGQLYATWLGESSKIDSLRDLVSSRDVPDKGVESRTYSS